MAVYKILRRAEWDDLQALGATAGAPVDLADGYVHLSAAHQVRETAARHFAGEGDLMLLAVDEAALGDALRWEPSRGGEDFPHLHAELPLSAVEWARPLPWRDGAHDFPAGIA